MSKFCRLMALVALCLASRATYAQIPPTNVYGIDMPDNSSIGNAGANRVRLRYNNSASNLEKSTNAGGYFQVPSIDQAPTWTGVHTFSTSSIGTAQTVQILMTNTTAATAGAQQLSPVHQQCGTGWDSTATASKSTCFGFQVRPYQTAGNPDMGLVFFKYQNSTSSATEQMTLATVGTDSFLTTPSRFFFGVNAANTAPGSSTNYLSIIAGTQTFNVSSGNRIAMSATDFSPSTDLAPTLGLAAKRWKETYSESYVGLFQTQTTSGAVTVAPTTGEFAQVIASAAITGITISAGKANQILTLELKQDAAGTSTWPTTITNARLTGGVFSKTVTANAIDTLTFRYNSTDSKWDQIGSTSTISLGVPHEDLDRYARACPQLRRLRCADEIFTRTFSRWDGNRTAA